MTRKCIKSAAKAVVAIFVSFSFTIATTFTLFEYARCLEQLHFLRFRRKKVEQRDVKPMSDTSLVEGECEEQASQLLEERRGDGNEQDDEKNVTAVHLNQLFYRGTVGKEQVVFQVFQKI